MSTIAPIPLTLRDGRRVVIRTTLPDDTPALFDFLDHVARTSEHTVTQPDEVRDPAKLRDRLQESLARDGCLSLVACDDAGAIVGDMEFRNFDRRRMAHHGFLGIGVHEAWRSRGVGSALIHALLDWARANPAIEQVCLGVFANNERAIRLYRRMSFVEIGRRPREFKIGPGHYVDDIQMMQYVKPESHFAPPPEE